MTLFREDVYGIPVTRPIIKPVEKFLDVHPAVDERVGDFRQRKLIRGRIIGGFEIGSLEFLKKFVIIRSRESIFPWSSYVNSLGTITRLKYLIV